MEKLTDINILKSKSVPMIEVRIEFDGNIELCEIINPVIESPMGVASRLEHLADRIKEYYAERNRLSQIFNHPENE